MKFIIHGANTALTPPSPPRVLALQKMLDSLPDGELLDTDGIAVRMSISRESASNNAHHATLNAYRTERWPGRRGVIYANIQTIEAWKKANP